MNRSTPEVGVPPELVDAAKRSEIAGAEFNRTSIDGLAAAWSQAVAAEGRQSPDEGVSALRTGTDEHDASLKVARAAYESIRSLVAELDVARATAESDTQRRPTAETSNQLSEGSSDRGGPTCLTTAAKARTL